ncbi:MAG TPA: thiol:disulfide interchange protein, partial [Aquabacterium sp.]|nr:thiol:disulfide interchange protein [Aquabacterium sp.]
MAPWGLAHAADPVEGSNYVKLSQRAPVSAPAGKVEVVEFFWYGCPHCY